MGADLSKVKSGTVIPASQALQQKERFAACEARIEAGLRSFADVGAALAEIRDSRLYLLAYGSFEEYVERRWELSRKRAYDTIANAAVCHKFVTKARPDLPVPAIESHAAALVKVPEDRRPEVWAKVVRDTGGRPTARAVAEAWQGLKDPHKDLKAGREAGKPQIPGGEGKGKPPVTAGDGTNAQNRREDSSRGKADRPANAVSGSVKTGTAEPVTTTTETAATATERKPHVCRVFACAGCGKTDTAFGEQAGKLMDELAEAREKARQLGAEVASLRAQLSDALKAAGQAGPGNGTPAGNTADSAHGNGQGTPALDGDGNVMPDYDDDLSWMDGPEPDYEASQVPGRRR